MLTRINSLFNNNRGVKVLTLFAVGSQVYTKYNILFRMTNIEIQIGTPVQSQE